MGKGDRKSKRGKISLGTYGNSRKRKAAKAGMRRSDEKVVAESVETPVKRKKTPRKKTEA
jgi:30S ribosomal protein S31